METTEIVHREDRMTLAEVKSNVDFIQQVMREVMKDGEHYGVIPGVKSKPTLLKPGAEKLCTTFRLSPTYKITKTDLPSGHREYEIVCTLTHIPSGQIFGEGVGSCSTLESKYRYREGRRACPECGSEAIIKGKAEYGGGWLCFQKKGGCGAKFATGDPVIEAQEVGRVENMDPADQYNTVLKMAKKRAHVDAVLTVTAASDIFTQDVEDVEPAEAPKRPRGRPRKEDPFKAESQEWNQDLIDGTNSAFAALIERHELDAVQVAQYLEHLQATSKSALFHIKRRAIGNPITFESKFNAWDAEGRTGEIIDADTAGVEAR